MEELFRLKGTYRLLSNNLSPEELSVTSHGKDDYSTAKKRHHKMNTEITSIIKSELDVRGITRSKLAKMLRCTPSAITNLLAEGKDFSVSNIVDLECALGLKILNYDYLLMRSGDSSEASFALSIRKENKKIIVNNDGSCLIENVSGKNDCV